MPNPRKYSYGRKGGAGYGQIRKQGFDPRFPAGNPQTGGAFAPPPRAGLPIQRDLNQRQRALDLRRKSQSIRKRRSPRAFI